MDTKRILRVALALASIATSTTALAQFPQLITDFQNSPDGVAYPVQIASLGDLKVVMFQDPAEADVTAANVKPDAQAIFSNGDPNLPSTSESFVAAFANFFGANGTSQFLDIRFQWVTPSSPTRWALIETLQSPFLGDPSVHLGGKVRFYVNLPNCAQFEYPGLVTPATEIGVALLIAETGNDLALGFQDAAPLLPTTRYEFVGVSSVDQTDPNYPIPVPSRFIPVTDANCEGLTTGPAGNWRLVEFNLPAESVIGWTAKGGNGTLNAADLGVNRGILAGLVVAVRQTDTTSDFVELLIDGVTFEAPVADPATAPTIGLPVIATQTSVTVKDVVPSATSVVVQVDRYDPNNPNGPFTVDQTFTNGAPGLGAATELRFANVTVSPALAVGDRLRAHQVVNGNTSPSSLEATVNPPAAFTATLSLDEDGNLGAAPADFEFVGAATTIGNAPQGHPVFVQNGVWQKVEFSLIPGIEPVTSFAGGDGSLTPTGGLYNIDALFLSIDTSAPNAGPYSIFLDHVYYIDASDNEQLIADSEFLNPFPSVRGQSTSTATTSIISGLASYDGSRSNRLGWTFPDTATSNTHAPFRPVEVFADSAKAVGMWMLVEDPRLSTLALPAIETWIIGSPSSVLVSNLDPTATQVRVLVNGAVAGSANPAGAASFNVPLSGSIPLGASVSAVYDVPGRATSDYAYARVAQSKPPVPAVQSTLVQGQTSVQVTGVLNTGNSVASLVTLYKNGVQIATLNPAGANNVTFTNLSPALVAGDQVKARQTVNTFESADSTTVVVGSGQRIRVVINEFQYDDSGADDQEFIELYNAEPMAVDISGWVVRGSDTVAPPNDNNKDFTIPAATVLAPGDFFLIAPATFPGVDLVPSPSTDLLENDNEALQLVDNNGIVIDTVIYERNKGPVAVSPGEGGLWGNFQSFVTTNLISYARWLDGFDTDNNGRDFGAVGATPGTTNNIAGVTTPYTDNFNGTTDLAVPDWTGAYVRLRYIDPAATSLGNPNIIPASPQGGGAATCFDNSGGGNQCVLYDRARFNVAFSCYIYINAAGPGFTSGGTAGEYETWAIGLGLADAVFNAFHVTGAANGNTGLMWQYVVAEDAGNTGVVGTQTLQLVDRNDGGNDGTVLLDIPAAAITTGWHTIGISRSYETVTAAFDGFAYAGTVPNLGPASLGIGYREFYDASLATARPPTIDGLTITIPAAPPVGACCYDTVCQIVTQAVCLAWAGEFKGNGTICDAETCLPEPEGACCFPDGSCTVATEAVCSGTWQGEGTNCSPNLCPQPPTGACCVGAACSITTEAACTGTWEGAGTDCDPNPCVQICLGDSNCSGAVDFFDIDPFVAKIGCPAIDPVGCDAGCQWQNSDVDQDGDVDFFDIDPFVATIGDICP